MDLCSFGLFDAGPEAFELSLHITPNLSRLVVKLHDLELSLLFEHIQAILPLNNRGLFHQEL